MENHDKVHTSYCALHNYKTKQQINTVDKEKIVSMLGRFSAKPNRFCPISVYNFEALYTADAISGTTGSYLYIYIFMQ